MNRILLLEDDISLIDGLKYSLEKNGFSLNIVNTISQAMESFAKNPKYDLLLLDLTLPDGTGFEVCEYVRNTGNSVPIIFLTASDEEVNVIRGLDGGGDHQPPAAVRGGGGQLWPRHPHQGEGEPVDAGHG